MPRRLLIRQNQFPYHVVSRSNNKNWFNLPMQEVWEIAIFAFTYAIDRFPVDVHAFVLMQNHYHLLLSTPDSNIDSFMQAFNKTFSELLKKKTLNINRMFGGPYKWSIIENQVYLYNTVRYIFQNPLRAKIADQVECYPYSTLFYEVKKINLRFKTKPFLDASNKNLISWYNNAFGPEETDCIRRGLRQKKVEFKKDRNSKVLPTFSLPT